MSTVNRTWGTRVHCFFRWTQSTRRSQLSSTMEDQSVSPLLLFSMLTMHGRERPLFCLLFLTKEPSPDSGQILLTRRYVCMGTGLCKVFCSRCCLVRLIYNILCYESFRYSRLLRRYGLRKEKNWKEQKRILSSASSCWKESLETSLISAERTLGMWMLRSFLSTAGFMPMRPVETSA